jgi:nucleotide-binding universal stress UspA family protein
MKLKRILCGVDFSDNSVRAFQTAVALAKATRAEVSVVHVIEPLPMTDQDIFALEEKARTALEALVREWANELDGGQVSTTVTTGRAFVELVNMARELEADLAVLGAKGITLLEEPFIGTTTEHVLKEAPCSVLVTKD